MSSRRSKRRLSNIKLTRKFHFQYMALWMTITITLLATINLMFYLLVSMRWGLESASIVGDEGGMIIFRPFIIAFLCLQTVAFSIAAVYLAKVTSHRIAGPYIGLMDTCRKVRDGDRDARQHFRGYDRLGDLEEAFNQMLDTLTGQPDRPQS